MSNNSKKQENQEFSFDTDIIMSAFSNFAPFLLLISAVGSFIIVGIFTADYYNTMFWARFGSFAFAMAVGVVVLEELTRFSFLVSSVKDFKDKKKAEGFFGLLISLILVAHDITIAIKVGNLWGLGELPLVFAIVIGFAIEIRMVMTMGRKETIAPQKEEEATTTLPIAKKTEPVAWNGKSVLDNAVIFTPIGFNAPQNTERTAMFSDVQPTKETVEENAQGEEKQPEKEKGAYVVHILKNGETRYFQEAAIKSRISQYAISKTAEGQASYQYWIGKLLELKNKNVEV
jgi:hypothetical protein